MKLIIKEKIIMKLAEKFNTDVKTFEHPEDGEYKLRLKEIEPCTLEYQGKSQDKLRWKFETIGSKECNVIDSNGKPYIVSYTTGLTYIGSQKANLTKLVKGLFGRNLTLDEFAELDEKDLIGREVGAVIEIIEKETGSYPSIILFKTIKKTVKPAAPAPAAPAPIAAQTAAQETAARAISEALKPAAPAVNSYAKYVDEAAAAVEEAEEYEEDIEDSPFI